MKTKIRNVFALVLIGVLSFFVFLYFLFPYQILKESLVSSLAKQTSYNVKILEMEPSLPLGLDIKKLVISTPGNELEISEVDFSISLWRLLVGNLGVSIELEDPSGGVAEGFLVFSLFDLISQNISPKSVEFTSQGFDVGQAANFVLKQKGDDPETDPLVQPVFSALHASGKLTSDIQISLDVKNPSQSKGSIAMKFDDARLVLTDPNFDLPDQVFSKAEIKAAVKNGVMEFSPESALISEHLEIFVGGSIKQAESLAKSEMDLKVDLSLKDVLETQFGWVIDLVTKNQNSGGRMTIRVADSLVSPTIDIQ